MKKLFTFVFALCAFSFAAKAQVTITLEAHDVWEDGSGYQLLLDADHTAYGTIIPEQGALTTSGDVPASTYAEFEYKIPENADGSLTTTRSQLQGRLRLHRHERRGREGGKRALHPSAGAERAGRPDETG